MAVLSLVMYSQKLVNPAVPKVKVPTASAPLVMDIVIYGKVGEVVEPPSPSITVKPVIEDSAQFPALYGLLPTVAFI